MFEISKMLTICTSHLTDRTLRSLDTEVSGNNYTFIAVYKKEDFGYFLYIDKDAYIEKCYDSTIPSDLRTVISLAIEAGCDILCLDSDGDELTCIPHYEYLNIHGNGHDISNDVSKELCYCGGDLIGETLLDYRV